MYVAACLAAIIALWSIAYEQEVGTKQHICVVRTFQTQSDVKEHTSVYFDPYMVRAM